MGFDDFLVHTATIKQPVPSSSGAYTVSETTLTTTAKVRLVPIDGQLRQTAYGRVADATHVLYLKGSQAIDQGYELTISGISGKEYRVVEVLNAHVIGTTTPHHVECLVKERRVL